MTRRDEIRKNLADDLLRAMIHEGGIGPLSEEKISEIENPVADDDDEDGRREFSLIVKLDTNKNYNDRR